MGWGTNVKESRIRVFEDVESDKFQRAVSTITNHFDVTQRLEYCLPY